MNKSDDISILWSFFLPPLNELHWSHSPPRRVCGSPRNRRLAKGGPEAGSRAVRATSYLPSCLGWHNRIEARLRWHYSVCSIPLVLVEIRHNWQRSWKTNPKPVLSLCSFHSRFVGHSLCLAPTNRKESLLQNNLQFPLQMLSNADSLILNSNGLR